jgi:predicted CXXCH cytochrome family protein
MAMIAGAAAGCVDEEIVYRDKPLFEDPPEAAVGFLGYSNVEQKKTTCGNCHAGQQVAWVESNHAEAWSSLQSSDHKADTCNDCHTVSNLGNAVPGATQVAYSATGDERYWDVQCESCHNGGLEHVQDPSSNTNKPLASMLTGENADGCGECHEGSHHPFVEEWAGSRHSRVDAHVAERDAASYGSCAGCHDGKVAMKTAFGVTTNFTERDDAGRYGVTCVVCHDPHGNGNTAQLRMEASSHDAATNLCSQCHRRNPVPSGGTTRNYPHAAQGLIVFGDVGWQPPGFPADKIYGTHGSEANEGMCVTCHMPTYSINATTNTTGHTFEAIACLDANGAPTSATDCTMTQRTFKSCLGSGCHGSEVAARSALIATEARLNAQSAELKRLVLAARATTKGAADWKTDTNVTALEGADFNSQIMEHDLSRGAHNPFLVDALLTASITYVKTYYGVN